MVPGPAPLEIRIRRASAILEIDFDDGTRAALPAEYLRVESPSAEVQGHGPGQKVIVPGKQGVNITAAEPIGHYAVRLRFSDGHDTGIYSWSYLHELFREHAVRWQAYQEALAIQGLSRDPDARTASTRPHIRRFGRHGA